MHLILTSGGADLAVTNVADDRHGLQKNYLFVTGYGVDSSVLSLLWHHSLIELVKMLDSGNSPSFVIVNYPLMYSEL